MFHSLRSIQFKIFDYSLSVHINNDFKTKKNDISKQIRSHHNGNKYYRINVRVYVMKFWAKQIQLFSKFMFVRFFWLTKDLCVCLDSAVKTKRIRLVMSLIHRISFCFYYSQQYYDGLRKLMEISYFF